MNQQTNAVTDEKMLINKKIEEIPVGFRGKLNLFFQYVKGKAIFLFLRVFHKSFVLSLSPLSEHLEKNIFPDLRRKRVKWLAVGVQKDTNGDLALRGQTEINRFDFPGTKKIADLFSAANIRTLKLNTLLESNQIIETMLIYLYAKPHRTEFLPVNRQTTTWKPKDISAQMLGDKGYHKFCADMRYDQPNKTFEVDYTYCELFMSKIMKGYAKRTTKHGDHRAFFAATPFLMSVSFLILTIPVMLLGMGVQLWPVIWIAAAVLPPVFSWFVMQAFGSVQYDKEHVELLNKEYLRQETSLARFPATNPNPVFKIDQTGKVIYANPAVYKLLSREKLAHDEINKILPANYREIITKSLDGGADHDVEIKFRDRIIRYLVSSFKEDRSAIFAGSDITHLRKIEEELSAINQNLESLVEARTKELRTTEDATIMSLASLAEVRDPETGGHIERTRLYVKALAENLKRHPKFQGYLTESRIDLLYKSAPLHDIGKVGVQDAILLKPGKLTSEEFNLMKKHTEYGETALRKAVEKLGFDSFLDIAKEIAACHHERWDGKGYPKGLQGEKIPLAARLMALADVYDALINKRVYKAAFSHDKAKSIIMEERGELFDPDIVDVFLNVEDEFVKIAESLSDNPTH